MSHTRACLMLIPLLLSGPWRAQAQDSFDDLIARYVNALKAETSVDAASKVEIIQYLEKSFAGMNSGYISGVLFNSCTFLLEPDTKVREAAATALGSVCNLANTMYVRRLMRIADPTVEPAPPVRMAALRSLAKSSSPMAAGRIQDSTKASEEPDPSVRACALALIRGNPSLAQ